ncbi:MAG: thiamine-phosphate kinase [Gammaproteobacteria bacterium]|nr:thiamine-phosphate kinase [Gammaproteobacteria bacterium]
MSFSEFDLIKKYFSDHASREDVVIGVGDDAAVLNVPTGQQLVVTTDTLIEGVHFPTETSAENIGHKSLAVSLSDLAAMGAEPAWATLSLAIPVYDEAWLTAFSHGFLGLAQKYNVSLVGGDTVRGPLSITVQLHGFVPEGKAIRRDGARGGDLIYVTGTPGDAGLALAGLQNRVNLDPVSLKRLRQRLDSPTPRVETGLALRGLASACIDISDGLLADLGHITAKSGIGADIMLEQLPLSTDTARYVANSGDWDMVLVSGDDYELCFTASENDKDKVEALGCTCIGRITGEKGIRCLQRDGSFYESGRTGFDHFAV